jgi:hypothetical protein
VKTTIDIPDEMLKSAMMYSGASTRREAIIAALTEFNRRRQLERVRAMLGTFKNIISVEALQELRDRNRITRRRGAFLRGRRGE